MALFQKSPEKILIAAINARDQLIARLSDSEVVIIERQTAAEQAAMDGADDNVLTIAEDKLRAAQERRVTLRAALTKSEALVDRLEQERAEQADKEEREKTAAEVELLAREVVEAGAAFVATAAKLADCSLRASVAAPEAAGLTRFARAVESEIPAGCNLTARLLRDHRAAVLARSAPALLAKPPEPYVAPPAPAKPPTQILFCLRSVKWIDDAGQQRIVGKFEDAEVPVRLVGRALKCGACVPITDPRRRELHGTRGGFPPRLDTATDLDADPATHAPVEPILASSPFTPVDRGPPITLRVAR
jgi:hypothetical protein